ncbi:hypothetical protein N0V82_007969 [Gnomoniopsis sp. IMI 355080]|nr:hypothetical protein N0V82_007969 [Gnomoniopsis sp. IMI 355080]
MAGKDYKVQKKAKEQQRLSVFQPAFRWGGNNANSSTGSSSKVEAKKNDRSGANRTDRLDRRQNERVDQPRRNDNRLAITEDPEARMARDAKRMTTFQPIFGSLFSSKPSKGKAPESSQLKQTQRPPANGPTSQYVNRNQAANPTRHDATNGVPSSSSATRYGPGYQGAGLRINTQETLGSNSRRNEATSNSSGRTGRGGLAPVPEGYSPRPRSPLQRNPAMSIPGDDLRPLGISNAFGPGARGKEKANAVGNTKANSADYLAGGNMRDPRTNGQDRGLGIALSSDPATTRNVSKTDNQKRSGADMDIDPATKRERIGIGFRRDDSDAANQSRLNENPIRKPVVSKSEPQADPRLQKQTGGRTLDDGKLAQPPVGRSQNVPQLIVTDTSEASSSKASSRPVGQSRGQQSISAISSKIVPGQGADSVRETSGSVRADGQSPSTSKAAVGSNARSALDRFAQRISYKATEDTKNVSSGRLQNDSQQEASSKRAPPQESASKPSLNVFPKQSIRQPLSGSESQTVMSKGVDPQRPILGREEGKTSSQVSTSARSALRIIANETKPKVRKVLDVPETRDVDSSPRSLHSDTSASRQSSHKQPFEAFNPFSARLTPQSDSPKTPAKSSRDQADSAKAHASGGNQQSTFDPFATRKPGHNEVTASSNQLKDGKLGRSVASRSEDRSRHIEPLQSSSAGSSMAKLEKSFAEQPTETQAVKPESSRTGWASRYFETSRNEKLDNSVPKVERTLDSGKGVGSTTTSREVARNPDRQISDATQQNGANSDATSFNQRMREGLSIGKESNLLNPLKSKFNGPKKQETSQKFPGQISQPLAGDAQAPQVDSTTTISQQREPPASLERPRKEYRPYSAAKATVAPEAKEDFGKSKASAVPEWLASTKREIPSRPERPQDELFMGDSGSTLRPIPLTDHTAPLKVSPASESRSKQNSPRDFNISLTEVKTDRSEILSTRKPAEATRPSKPEQDSREYTVVTAGAPVNLVGETSRSAKPEASSVRVVSGIMERPKEIDIQKSSRSAKNTRPSSSEAQSNRDMAEKPETMSSRQQKETDAKQIDSLPSKVADNLQIANYSGRLNTQRGDQGRRFENNEPQQQALVDEWPRPMLASSRAAHKDITDHSQAVEGDKISNSEGRAVNISGDLPILEPEATQTRGLLGRWAGRGKKDKTTERSNQSPAIKQSVVTTDPGTATIFESELGGQKLPPRHDSEGVVPAVRSAQRTRDNTDAPSIQVMEPNAKSITESSSASKSASAGTTFGSSSEQVATPAQLSIPDAPAPLRVGGRRPAQFEESESKSREGIELHLSPNADKQASTNGKLTDHGMPHAIRAGDLDVSSPPLLSQEDFFKQMRQSVMFQNADSAEKTGLPEPTDTTSKRKSRRNRNVSISGLQPPREVGVPDIPTLDNSNYRSIVGGGDSHSPAYPGVPQTASDSWPGQAIFGTSKERQVSGERARNDASNVTIDEPKIREMKVMPVTTPSPSHAHGTEQAEVRSPYMSSKLQRPSGTDSTLTGFEQTPTLDASLPTTLTGPRTDITVQEDKTPRVTESGRVPLYPVPSSAGILRRPSFGDQEGLQPISTHELPPSDIQADRKVQDFFEGLFKSKKSEDFASGLGSSSSTKEEVARELPGVDLTNGEPVKGLSVMPQSISARKDSPYPNGIPSSSSLSLQGQPDGRNHEQSEVDARPSFDKLRSPMQTAVEAPSAKSTPITPHPPIMSGVENPSVPLHMTSKSPEITGPLFTEKTTEGPSPYSTEVPMLFVEEESASPMSRREAATDRSISTEPSREVNQHFRKFETGDSMNSPQMPDGTRGSSASSYPEQVKQTSLDSSAMIQGKEFNQGEDSPFAAHEPSSRSFVKENAFIPGQSDVMVGNSHVQQVTANSMYSSPNKTELGQSGDEQTNVFPVTPPTFFMHEERQKEFASPSELDGHWKKAAVSRSFESPLISSREAVSSEEHASPWAQVAERQGDSANPYRSQHEPGHLQSPEGRVYSQYPAADGGLATSPQDSERDLSDQILSLYDGSGSATPDRQSTGRFPQFSSSSNRHDNRSIMDSPDPATRSALSEIKEPREVSDSVKTDIESMEPAPSNYGGIKDRLRTLFSKTASAEPDYVSHASPVMNSNVHESFDSPELSEKTAGPHDDQAMSRNYTSPIFESRLDDMDLQQDRTFSGVANMDSTRSAADVTPALLSPQAAKEDHLTPEAMSPEPSRDFDMPLHVSEQEASPNPVLRPEPMPEITPPGQWDHPSKPMAVETPREEVSSPDVDHRSVTVSPRDTGVDQDQSSLRSPEGMPEMDGFGPEGLPMATEERTGVSASRPGSHVREAIYDTTSHATPDLHETGKHESENPDIFNQSVISPVDHVDAFDPMGSQTRPMGETSFADGYLQMSPPRTAHITDDDSPRDLRMSGDDEVRASSARGSEYDIASPAPEHDAFRYGASPMPQGDQYPALDDMEKPHGDSPKLGHMDDEIFAESASASPSAMAAKESFTPHSPESEAWNDRMVQTRSFSPTELDRNGGENSAVILGGPEPDFDAVAKYPDDRDVPNGRLYAEDGPIADKFNDTVKEDVHFQDSQDSPNGLEHTSAYAPAFGNNEAHEEGFDDFHGDDTPLDDLQSGTGYHDGDGAQSHPIHEHESHVGGFDDFAVDGLPAEEIEGSSATFDTPRQGSPPVDAFPRNDSVLEEDQVHASHAHQNDLGGLDDGDMDHYPADDTPNFGGALEETAMDNYPVNDVQSHPATSNDADTDLSPEDDIIGDTNGPHDPALDNYGVHGVEDLDEINGYPSEPMGQEPPLYEPDHEVAHLSDDAGDFDAREDVPYEEPAFSDHGEERETGMEPGQVFGDNELHDDYPQGSPLDEDHFETGGLSGGEPVLHDQGDEMDYADNREGDFDELGGTGEWHGQGQDAEVDHGFSDNDLDDLYGEPSREVEAEPTDFVGGGIVDDDEPLAADWDGDRLDEGRGLDEAEEYPIHAGGDDFPMGGEAEEYLLGGDGLPSPDAMQGEDLPMGGEADEYLMGGEGHYPMDEMDERDSFRGEGDEALPIDEMYGEEERTMEPLEAEEFPMEGERPLSMMDGEEYPMDQQVEYPMDTMGEGDSFRGEGDEELPIDEMYGEEERCMEPLEEDDFPMGDEDLLPMAEGEEYPMDDQEELPTDGQNELPMEGEGVEESDRGIDDFDADDQAGDGMSMHDSVLDEEHESQFDDGSIEARSLVDEEAESDLEEASMGSEISDPFDEEPVNNYDHEDEEHALSEVDDREIEEGQSSSAEQEERDEEGEGTMDDLYEADIPSIPASPALTDYGRELASPTSVLDNDEDDQDEDSIFGEPAAQQDPADLENADPVRLSCLYMQDVGLMSIPSTPTVPLEDEIPEEGEEEAEEPREPVRFSALYRQSLDWSQALDPSMWEDFQDTLPEESEEQVFTAPVLQPVPESAKRGSHEDLRMLEVDQEPLTPVAASPLSPRPLETPPPDFDHDNGTNGYMETPQLVDQMGELSKGADDDADQQRFPTSPRLQPTPPPDQDRAPSSIDSNDRRDSRGPRTFEEMNLPRRVISPPVTGDDQDESAQGSSSTHIPTHNSRRSISQRFSGWWTGAGSSGQVPARPPPLPSPYDSRYGEPNSPA